MTGRHTRHIVLAVLALAVVSLPVFAQQDRVADLRARAEQGDADAQYRLGRMYDNGEGVPQDYVEAVRWYRLAADQGHASGMMGLAFKYSLAEPGIQRDLVKAHMWTNLAASRFTDEFPRRLAVGNRDRFEGQMTRDQIAEAQRLAREWEVAHPREP